MPVGAVPFPFGKCRICKDRATGVHYGVATCEGCKGFFKRSITKSEKYKCFFGGSCDVTPKNRNRCKSCRFRLCLENGMSVEAVRMGRIPKVEKEKALEAVKTSDQPQMDEPYLHMGSDYDDYPKYTEPEGSFHPTTSSAAAYTSPMGPEIYDFDTGCISRQNHTLADDRERHFSETVTKTPDKDQRSREEGVPLVHNEASVTIGNTEVKKEFDTRELTSTCHYSQHNNTSSSMAIRENSKETKVIPFERQSDTYQFCNVAGDAFKANSVFTKDQYCANKDMFGINEMFQSHPHHKSDVNRSHDQDQVADRIGHQSTSHVKPYHDSNRYSCTENSLTFGNSPQWCSSETSGYKQAEHINHTHNSVSMATSFTLTSGTSTHSSQIAGQSMNIPLHHENNHPKTHFENLHLKTEPIDIDFTDDFHNYETDNTVPQDNMNVPGKNRTDVPLDKDQSLSTQSTPQTNVQASISQLKLPIPPFDFSRHERSPSVLSSSCAPTCPTPSTVDGSTTSSQRGRFSPALIKVLLEQVLDSTQETDVTLRLQQRLEHNRVDKGVVANVLNLIREVSAKRNKVGGSEESNLMSSAETCSEKSSLAESKMENIQRFLEDVNKFSRPEPLLSPPLGSPQFYHQQPSYGIASNVTDRFNPNPRFNCSPLKRRFLSSDNIPNNTIGIEKNSSDMGQNKMDKTSFDAVKESSTLFGTQSEKMEASCSSKIELGKKYPLPEVNLTLCEQSKTIESSQHEERPTVSQNSPAPCDLINQSINENEVTCSDDKLSREEVKKQVIQMTLEGLSFASKILNRMKPEHRERLRLWKNGLLKLRVLPTDTEEEMAETYQKIIAGIAPLNERVLGFCEQVPGFSNINSEDRAILLKRAYYDIWMLTSAEYFSENAVNIITLSGEIYSRKAMEKILNKEITTTLMNFASQFNKLNLSDLEIAILCAVRLTCSDELAVKDRFTIQKLHSLMLDVLAVEIEQSHPDNHTRLLITVFELMPLLETTNKAQCRIIAEFPIDKHGSAKEKKN